MLTPKDIQNQLLNAIKNDPSLEDFEKEAFTNPRSQRSPRFQSGEELANSVGKINAYHSL